MVSFEVKKKNWHYRMQYTARVSEKTGTHSLLLFMWVDQPNLAHTAFHRVDRPRNCALNDQPFAG
jgi:hypothetical protein